MTQSNIIFWTTLGAADRDFKFPKQVRISSPDPPTTIFGTACFLFYAQQHLPSCPIPPSLAYCCPCPQLTWWGRGPQSCFCPAPSGLHRKPDSTGNNRSSSSGQVPPSCPIPGVPCQPRIKGRRKNLAELSFSHSCSLLPQLECAGGARAVVISLCTQRHN